MGNPIKRKKIRRFEAYKASLIEKEQKNTETKVEDIKVINESELPNGLVFLEEKQEDVVLDTIAVEEVKTQEKSKKKKSLQDN